MNAKKTEFIGEKIKIIDSTKKDLVGLEGVVVDETKNTITINCAKDKTQKKFFKNTLTFEMNGNKIDGKTILFRPHERIKKIK